MTDTIDEKIVPGCHFGPRDDRFKDLIKNILKTSGVKHVKTLTSPESMRIYSDAFTSESVDKNNNYQVLEQLGDLSANKFIAYYMYKKFPQLKCTEGVKVVARLRINYGSKNTFAKIAEQCGFWDYITATNELRLRERKSLLEDVFEAFLGATEVILDRHTAEKFEQSDDFVGVGYANVYKILKTIFDGMNISLDYNDLYDAKTRLKELFDLYGDDSPKTNRKGITLPPLGPLLYETEKKKEEGLNVCKIYRLQGASYEVRPDGTINMKKIICPPRQHINNCKLLLGQASATLKDEAEQLSATRALETLAKQGYIKHPPSVYAKFSGKNKVIQHATNESDVLRICGSKENINEQFPTRGKSKYQSKYTSTPLIHYCRERDLEGINICLEWGANVNIPDYIGMYALDVLCIGEEANENVEDATKKLFEKTNMVKMHADVYESYRSKYKSLFKLYKTKISFE